MLRLPFTSKEHLAAAAGAVRDAIAGHGVVAIPTETFYGLAVNPEDYEAVERVFDLEPLREFRDDDDGVVHCRRLRAVSRCCCIATS